MHQPTSVAADGVGVTATPPTQKLLQHHSESGKATPATQRCADRGVCDRVVREKAMYDKVLCGRDVRDKVVCYRAVCITGEERRRREDGEGAAGGGQVQSKQEHKNPAQ